MTGPRDRGRLHELGLLVAGSSSLLAAARPQLRSLAVATEETVMLSVLEGREVFYLDREEGSRTIRMVAGVGHRSPLHSNASGKVLLAHQAESFVAGYLDGPLERFTASTIVEREQLRCHLGAVVADGYATCWQEHESELCSVSVPIFDFTGTVVAALTIAGPVSRIAPDRYEHLLPPLRERAGEISAGLGAVDLPGRPAAPASER